MPDWKKQIREAMAGAKLDPGQEASIVEELANHFSEQYAEMLSAGLSEAEAYRKIWEELRKQDWSAELRPVFSPRPETIVPGGEEPSGLFAGLGKDLLWGWRSLRLNPGFAAVAILSLALGMGANTAIFQLIDAVLLRTLPVADPQALANVTIIHKGRVGSTVGRQQEASFPIWEQVQQQQKGFSHVAAWVTEPLNLANGGESQMAEGLWVSGDFFSTLQVKPAAGRLFTEADDRKGCGSVGAVISYPFWMAKFGGSADVVGKTISLDRRPFPIIGVTARSFSGIEVGHKFDVALPLCSEPFLHTEEVWSKSKTTWWLDIVGRLKPGITLEQASAQLAAASPAVFAATLPLGYDTVEREHYLRFTAKASSAGMGVSSLRTDYEYPLWILLAISGLVLLIACANIANLMLARATARQQEMALRLALGASRSRLIRQLLIESLMLAGAGGVIGGALAGLLSRALVATISSKQDQVYLLVSTDWRVLWFTAGLAVLTCIVFGLAPALHAANTDPGAVIKASGRALTASRNRLFLQRGLVVGQVALSLALVVAALLFVRTFRNLVTLSVGFNQDHILVADFDFTHLNVPVEKRLEYKRQLLDQVRAVPGVISAASTLIVPLSGDGWNEFIDIPSTKMERKLVYFAGVSPDYFNTLDVPIVAGRDLEQSDNAHSAPVAVVNEAFAKEYLGGGNAVGKTFGMRREPKTPDKMYRIVGMVRNTKYRTLKEPYVPIAYVSQYQNAQPDADLTMVIHSNQAMGSLISSLRTLAEKNNPQMFLEFSVLRRNVQETLPRERLMATLSGFYGALAAVLSLVGLYGMISYMTVRRTSELGIRMALGASRGRILGMILRDGLSILALGVALGTVIVMVSGRAVEALLFGLNAIDPISMGVAVAGMTMIAVVACLVPARRAAGLEPMRALREE